MYRNFFRLTSAFTVREGFLEAWGRSFSTPFVISLFKIKPDERSVYRSSPYELDGGTRRRFELSSRLRIHALWRMASSSATITGIGADLTLTGTATGASSTSLTVVLVMVLVSSGMGVSDMTLTNPHTWIFCKFELLASLTFTEHQLSRTLWREVFLPSTGDLMTFASGEGRPVFLNSLLGAVVQSTHPALIFDGKLRIRTIDDTNTLFERGLEFSEDIKPIKKVD